MLIQKQLATVIAYGSSDAHMYRMCLEVCNYQVKVIWIGSIEELKQTFNDSSVTDDMIVIDAHGDEEKGFVAEGDEMFSFADIASAKGLQGKTILSTACYSGTTEFAKSFKSASVKSYVAPVDGVTGPVSIMFITSLFYSLNKTAFYPELEKMTWEESVAEAVKLSSDEWSVTT